MTGHVYSNTERPGEQAIKNVKAGRMKAWNECGSVSPVQQSEPIVLIPLYKMCVFRQGAGQWQTAGVVERQKGKVGIVSYFSTYDTKLKLTKRKFFSWVTTYRTKKCNCLHIEHIYQRGGTPTTLSNNDF